MVKAESCVDLEGSHLLVMRTGIPTQRVVSSFQYLRIGAVRKNEDDLPSIPRGARIYNLIDKKCSNELVVPQKRILIP